MLVEKQLMSVVFISKTVLILIHARSQDFSWGGGGVWGYSPPRKWVI